MEFKELISDFSTRHGVEGLAAEDDSVTFNVDDIAVFIAADDGEVAITSEIGEPPVEGRADFADLLLTTNFNDSTAVFGKSQDSGMYVLTRRLPLASIDGGAFDTALEELVNQAENWRTLLATFRPAAEAAAAAKDEVPAIGMTGFLRV
ncbi:MAG: type III secretion system chaperone [Victivallales bacterium]|nr:type III secretion system chaperone [Victivallales bacterium]MBO7535059.1 type III secretion system chaperone [Victivallales bacterium]MBO7620354.1 type III secretion system chaperone [Victivallales bacterium]